MYNYTPVALVIIQSFEFVLNLCVYIRKVSIRDRNFDNAIYKSMYVFPTPSWCAKIDRLGYQLWYVYFGTVNNSRNLHRLCHM